MDKILGIDLGTNSIGLTIREDNEFEWFGVYTFSKGVGKNKSGEFSFASERTKHRSARRLYNARRYRKWETLKILINNGYCPLEIEELNRWKNYEKGIGRVFPMDNEKFNQWIKLDFNLDGKPDYRSPYQLRRELIETKLNLDVDEDKYKIGRALYHIAQRRGFRSSRKIGKNEKAAIYRGSPETGTIGRNKYEELIESKGSLGAAFAHLEDEGIRIRNRYTLREDFEKEVEKIIEVQKIDNDFKTIVAKAMFWQRPLRSQKGLVGKCTLEKSKYRCPVSHPKFEEFRAWSFLNTLKYKKNDDDKFIPLPLKLKKDIYNDLFFRQKSKFEFLDIRKYIEKKASKAWQLNYKRKLDKINVAGCPVSARLKAIFGEDWQNLIIKTNKTKKNKNGENKQISFDINDIWHLIFSFEDEEIFKETLLHKLKLSEEQIKGLSTLWNSFPVGYANLSLKAINNILPFLQEGLIYTEAVLLAKIPELIGSELFEQNKEKIIDDIKNEISKNRKEKELIIITNNLISKYKALDFEEKFGHKNDEYKLQQSDLNEVEQTIITHFGENKWENKIEDKKQEIINSVIERYQTFFRIEPKSYIKPPHLLDQIKEFVDNKFDVEEKKLAKLYHPSQIAIYKKEDDQQYLKSPKTAAFKNPMAYKTLYRLREVINYLIKIGKIDSQTKIVVEIARDLNDANKRNAIETYQRRREAENESYAKAIAELLKDPEFKGNANPESNEDKRKFRIWTEQFENSETVAEEIKKIEKNKSFSIAKKDIAKYRLWREQNCRCIYTGRTINLTDLFNSNTIDFEHTIPRSKSFDNSLANLTVCYADYNRNIKANKIPTQLPNYKEDYNNYTAIEPRLQNWKDRIIQLEKLIDRQKYNSKIAIDKDTKDQAIRKKHLLYFEYDYLKNKVDRFTRKDIPQGFVNSQLRDTQIISKYAYHYLKTVFNKVEVQKGKITAEFRKIYKIQNKKETKNRTKHYHHAIDAAVLTLIPNSAKREEILKKAYKYNETTHKQYTEEPFVGFSQKQITDIEKTILINNMPNKDKALGSGKKIVRRRGKKVWLRDKNNKIRIDENGDKIFKIADGDSIRGKLHQETFYGKIKIAAKNKDGKPLKDEDGHFIIAKNKQGKDEEWAVVRVLAKDLSINKKNIITNEIIDIHLKIYMQEQIDEGKKETELLDFNNKIIRRVRCRVKAGRGFMSPENLTPIKKQTYLSIYEHKQDYYVNSGDNYLFGLYETDNGKREIKSVNIYEASKINGLNKVSSIEDLFEPQIYIGKKKEKATRKHIFKIGQKVLFFEDKKEELKDIEPIELSKRLYYIKRLHQASVGNILFQHHLEARSEDQLKEDFPSKIFKNAGKDGFSKFQTDFIAPRLLFKPIKNNFIIEGKDFTISLSGKINFLFKKSYSQ